MRVILRYIRCISFLYFDVKVIMGRRVVFRGYGNVVFIFFGGFCFF